MEMHNELLVLLLRHHCQKFRDSCSPSLIEIMLKYYKLVPNEYYELQNKYKNENVGLIHFAGQTIEGLRIERHIPGPGQSFVERVCEEWPKGNLIGLYCVIPEINKCHGWIVSGISGERIFLLSKYSEDGKGSGCETAYMDRSLYGEDAIQITDLIFGIPMGQQ